MEDRDASNFANQAYEQAQMLSYAILAVIQRPESLPATLACMMMSKFCKMKFISSMPGLSSNDADLMLRDLEDIIEHNAGPMMEKLMKRRDTHE
jgi:hypothetical protein